MWNESIQLLRWVKHPGESPLFSYRFQWSTRTWQISNFLPNTDYDNVRYVYRGMLMTKVCKEQPNWTETYKRHILRGSFTHKVSSFLLSSFWVSFLKSLCLNDISILELCCLEPHIGTTFLSLWQKANFLHWRLPEEHHPLSKWFFLLHELWTFQTLLTSEISHIAKTHIYNLLRHHKGGADLRVMSE